MATHFQFLDLPRELRDKIYHQYVSVGGYTHNFDKQQLRTANDEPINLDFMYTCRQVAHEMKGVAFKTNVITFFTTRPENTRQHAQTHASVSAYVHDLKCKVFRIVNLSFTKEHKSQVSRLYPSFMFAFDDNAQLWNCSHLGDSPAVFHDALDYSLSLVLNHLRFPEVVEQAGLRSDVIAIINTVLYLQWKPWSISTKEDIDSINFISGFPENGWDLDKIDIARYCFSATAACISFLESIPLSTRSQIRNIIIDEDYAALGNPACHARGLIPYCQQNRHLRIERRVNLWRNVFMYSILETKERLTDFEEFHGLRSEGAARLSRYMTLAVADWTIEALGLVPAGMPPESFSLVFDGEPSTIRASEIFKDVIHRDVTWQVALEKAIALGYLKEPATWDRRHSIYEYYLRKKFPKALRDIIDGTSIVKCNFDPGEMSSQLDIEELVKEHHAWTWDEWEGQNKWNREPVNLETGPLLPGWKALVRERFRVELPSPEEADLDVEGEEEDRDQDQDREEEEEEEGEGEGVTGLETYIDESLAALFRLRRQL
ncbi:hypothetical protein F4677DRAFT_451636 [Hypoxylon crocopeplum]|nr:hypothetical protein F4677DRAFT_451636 [Hypoxylon crocopeplum]